MKVEGYIIGINLFDSWNQTFKDHQYAKKKQVLVLKLIAKANNRNQNFGSIRIIFDFLSQPADMDIHGTL